MQEQIIPAQADTKTEYQDILEEEEDSIFLLKNFIR
jgi:hypothetical protein